MAIVAAAIIDAAIIVRQPHQIQSKSYMRITFRLSHATKDDRSRLSATATAIALTSTAALVSVLVVSVILSSR